MREVRYELKIDTTAVMSRQINEKENTQKQVRYEIKLGERKGNKLSKINRFFTLV